MGIVTGVHRYQWGVGGNLTYSDCIQTDASINPGNSGGPLFNMAGEVVGINGRISVNTRGRYNVGFGYAISANQIRRFIPAMRAGQLARHGTLLATVETDDAGHLLFQQIAADSPLHEVEVKVGDRLVSFGGVELRSANHLVSVQGAYPEDWPIIVEIERDGQRFNQLVRLAPVIPKLKQPYTVADAILQRETQIVLDQYRSATLTKIDQPLPTRTWLVTREFLDGSDNTKQTWVAEHRPSEVIRYTRRYEDGREGAIINVRAEVAERRESAEAEAAPLPAEMQMVQLALFALQDRLLHGESGEPAPAALTTADFATQQQGVNSASATWAVVGLTIGASVAAKFSFDPLTGLCMRVRVKDVPSGAEATIELLEHRDVGGLVWPGTLEVIGRNFRYRDTLSNWEPAP
jgi:membrane-associated protease RseP (regulator of RpoE activity)